MRVMIGIVGMSLFCASAAIGQERLKGSGTSKTESREAGEFKGIDMRGSGRAEFSVGATPSIEITADDNILPLVETRVEFGKLVIDTAKGKFEPKTEIVIKVTTPKIESVQSAGAAKIQISGIENETFELKTDGAGSVKVAGKTASFTAKMNGATDLNASDLASAGVILEMRGAGKATVNAEKTLVVNIEGTSSVEYLGEPRIKQKIMGSGRVKPKEKD